MFTSIDTTSFTSQPSWVACWLHRCRYHSLDPWWQGLFELAAGWPVHHRGWCWCRSSPLTVWEHHDFWWCGDSLDSQADGLVLWVLMPTRCPSQAVSPTFHLRWRLAGFFCRHTLDLGGTITNSKIRWVMAPTTLMPMQPSGSFTAVVVRTPSSSLLWAVVQHNWLRRSYNFAWWWCSNDTIEFTGASTTSPPGGAGNDSIAWTTELRQDVASNGNYFTLGHPAPTLVLKLLHYPDWSQHGDCSNTTVVFSGGVAYITGVNTSKVICNCKKVPSTVPDYWLISRFKIQEV